MATTEQSFDTILGKCLDVFLKKNKDYGTSWRVLRASSLTDQILIKISRLRSIDEKGQQKVNDPTDLEFYGLINYSVMALMQLDDLADIDADAELSEEQLQTMYQNQIDKARALLGNKNHDYGEIWRLMRVSSIIDIILMKVHRIISIEKNSGKTLVSEGIDAGYLDIINYCVFALILLEESKSE